MSGFAIHTLGCKVNFYESAALEEACRPVLEDAAPGAGGDSDRPAVIVVNTCAVTTRAGRQSRQLIRRLRRRYPDALLVVTGCYAQLAPEAVAAIPGVAAVVGNPGKEQLAAWLANRLAPAVAASSGPAATFSPALPFFSSGPASPLSPVTSPSPSASVSPLPSPVSIPPFPPPHYPLPLTAAAPECFGFAGELPATALRATGFGNRARAFLKLQDGCDSFCRYCIIPRLRGRSRSVPPDLAADEACRLASAGFHEIVLTGVHLGCYGMDLEPRTSLAELVDRLRTAAPKARLRLGSLQPQEITPRLLELITATDSGVCAHLHLSLQSGEDRVLAAMGRPYGSAAVTALMSDLARSSARVAIGADVICGFPGETEAAFAATRALIRDLPFAYLHVFPWSPRPGTPAAEMPGQLSEDERRRRAKELMRLGKIKKTSFYLQHIMQRINVIPERVERCGHGAGDSVWGAAGHSDNYLKVVVEGARETLEDLVGCQITVLPHTLMDGVLRARL